MGKGRLEAFSDGVIAVIITIMVLELKSPHGTDLAALAPVAPALLTYVLSFVYVGIYWNNHHHMLHAAQHIDGRVLWANLHLLFWPPSTTLTPDQEHAPRIDVESGPGFSDPAVVRERRQKSRCRLAQRTRPSMCWAACSMWWWLFQ